MKYRIMINSEDGKRIRAERETYNVQASALSRENDFDAALNPKTIPAGSECEETASDMLARFGIDFRAVLVGDDCPTSCEDAAKDKDMDKLNDWPRKSHIHGKHYRCTFSAKGRGHMSIDFWNSYADEEQNAFHHGHVWNQAERYWDKYRGGKYPVHIRKPRLIPTAYDVIACITKSEVGTFGDFCSDFGYDSDSRKAEQVYNAVVVEWRKVQKFFTPSELAELQEVN